jgi:hypothetical protein
VRDGVLKLQVRRDERRTGLPSAEVELERR